MLSVTSAARKIAKCQVSSGKWLAMSPEPLGATVRCTAVSDPSQIRSPAPWHLALNTWPLSDWSRTPVLPRASPDPKSGGFAGSLVCEEKEEAGRRKEEVASAIDGSTSPFLLPLSSLEMAVRAGIAPATTRSTGGRSSWLS